MNSKHLGPQPNHTSLPILASESPGDSKEQREAEEKLLGELRNQFALKLRKKRYPLPAGGWLEIDGVCDSPRTFCEAWAHQGVPKSAQKNKVMTDAFKMLYATQLKDEAARKILLFGDKQAASHFKGNSWMAHALRHFGIEVVVVQLPEHTKDRIRKAQQRQFR